MLRNQPRLIHDAEIFVYHRTVDGYTVGSGSMLLVGCRDCTSVWRSPRQYVSVVDLIEMRRLALLHGSRCPSPYVELLTLLNKLGQRVRKIVA